MTDTAHDEPKTPADTPVEETGEDLLPEGDELSDDFEGEEAEPLGLFAQALAAAGVTAEGGEVTFQDEEEDVAFGEPVEEAVAIDEAVAIEEAVVVEVGAAPAQDAAVEATEVETPVEVEVADAVTEEAEEAEEADVADQPASPYDLQGDWYVIHSYSGYENKVKANLESRVHSMHMEDNVFDVVIPMEDVVEIKGGRKVTVPKKVFPGYLLVRMYLTDDSWFAVRNTPGVTGFVGSGSKPTSLSRREVERILGVRKDEAAPKATPLYKPEWDVGETVRVVEGPFADFNGVIEDINLDQSKVRVLVNIFGRETPVELSFEQIQKL